MKFALQGQPNVFLSPPPEIILLANLRVAPFQGAFPRVLIPRPKGLGLEFGHSKEGIQAAALRVA
jgi:hypothetical protein